MRLHLDTGSTVSASQAGGVAGPQRETAASAGSGASARDSVGLSGVSAALNGASTDRAARIRQLSLSVGNGSYQVPSAALSGALVGAAIS